MDFTMDFVVYVLWSPKYRKRYVGMTSNLIGRFESHNSLGRKGWTIKFRPWHVIHVEFYTTKKDAKNREDFLKTGRGREWMDLNLDMDS
ncbi:GIY-YIG nuclease family protein [Gelidibacter japonicus]|uniref:GIY-YIG nuclease family protein n=1 Tax=Gelidibacter japonicus TaxID=1962232 RepID=UPI00202053F3|nr:GIY-YIG nuclease family protein [Gelidibacter japonicus]MCL8008640.1 GIY-YIG nuclease family protein [Gelidibacter japonicus]